MEEFNKQKLTQLLINDPTLSSEWIENAIKILEEYNDCLDYKHLMDFTAKELETALHLASYFFGIEDSLDYMRINNFNDTQLQVIVSAVDNGVDFEWIKQNMTSNIPYAKMNFILAGIKDGFEEFKDTKYLSYTADQLQEIYSAKKENLDYDIWDDPINISAEVMQICRHAVSIGLKVEGIDTKNNKLSIIY